MLRFYFTAVFLLLNLLSITAAEARYVVSENRAYSEIHSSSDNHLDGCLYYFDYWNEELNHSALWLFLKSGSQTVNLTKVEFKISSENFTLKVSEDGTGAYLIPTQQSERSSCIDFKINSAVPLNNLSLQALEMVLIPEGSFYIGAAKSFADRNNLDTSRGSTAAPINAFYKSGNKGEYAGAYLIDSEDPIQIGECPDCLTYKDAVIPGVNTYSGDKVGRLDEGFPKGYEAFYQMRFELTESEYCTFLNTLTPEQQQNRINLQESYADLSRSEYGNFIKKENGKFVTSKPRQACSFLSWNDCLAYADWAGIRPMTEAEFEKSARGYAAPQFREYCWGGSEINNQYFLDTELQFSQSPKSYNSIDGNIHVNYLGFTNFRDVCGSKGNDSDYIGCRVLNKDLNYRGPLQTGIHAFNAKVKNRVSTGGGYFGTMELSGNLREPVVPLGSENSRKFKGINGDGKLDLAGNTTVQNWLYDSSESLVFGYRGGCWAFHENHARIADRFNTYRLDANQRKPYSGFRGVR